jgi:phage tail sheath protein FI
MCGIVDNTALTDAVTYCETRGDSFLVVDSEAGDDATAAVSYANGVGSSSYSAVYYPHLYIPDPASNALPGATRLIPPGGTVVGQYISTDVTRGVFKAPAGIGNNVRNVVATEVRLTNADLDELNVNASQAPVNVIRPIPGAGICVMGAKTLKPSTADRFVPVRRTLNYIKKELVTRTQFAIFEPNNSTLWDQLREGLTGFLSEFWQAGGLRGATPSAAFFVVCDSSNNTPTTIAAGEVRVDVGVAVQYPAEFVIIRLGQFETGATVTES